MIDDDRIIDLGSGWYRVEDGWTEDEIVSDLRSTIRGDLRAERYIRERVREIFASGAAKPYVPADATPRGVPPPGGGLWRDRIVDKARELMGPDRAGPDPLQEVVAEALGVTDRYVRTVGGPWRAILLDARQDRSSG